MSDTPTSVDPRTTCPIGCEDAGPLCLLRHIGQHSTIKLVRLSGSQDLAEVAVAAREPIPMGSVYRPLNAAPPTGTSDRPSLHRCERSSPVRNRKLEICTSGSVRGEDGNVLTYSASSGAAISEWCRTHRHLPIPEQHDQLVAKMRGHYAYYGITGNIRRISWYANQVQRIWQKWLSRRGSRFPWDRYIDLLRRHPIPAPRIVHRYTAVSEALP